MNYKNPYSILSSFGLDIGEMSNLKRIRQELMLRFELTGNTTIRISEKEYDKSSINNLFEELKNNGKFHKRIFLNKDLLALLEEGNLMLFNKRFAWEDFDDESFSDFVFPIFTYKMQGIIMNLILMPDVEWKNKLRIIGQTNFVIPERIRYIIYSKAFTHFDLQFQSLENDIKTPFENMDKRRKLKKDILDQFHPSLLEVISVLPSDIFDSLLVKYAKIGRILISKAYYIGRTYDEFERRTLRALVQAGIIYLTLHPEDENVANITDGATNYLRHSVGEEDDFSPVLGLGVLIICIFLAISIFTKDETPPKPQIKYKDVTSYFVLEKIKDRTFYTTKTLDYKSTLAKWSIKFPKQIENAFIYVTLWNDDGDFLCALERPIEFNHSILSNTHCLEIIPVGNFIYNSCELDKESELNLVDQVKLTMMTDTLVGNFIDENNKTSFHNLKVGEVMFTKY